MLGGEQSGHIIMLDHATTGDGLLTALHLLATAARQALPLAELAAVMTRYPQVLVNVPRGGQGPGRRLAGARRGRGRRRGGAGHLRPGAGPAERHRAGGPGHGRGRETPTRPSRVADRLAAAVRAARLTPVTPPPAPPG